MKTWLAEDCVYASLFDSKLLDFIFADLDKLTYNPSKMSVSSSPPGGLCAFDSSCTGGWDVNGASPWIELDLGYLYYITTLNITISNGTLNNAVFEYKKHPDQKWKTLDNEMVMSCYFSSSYF